MFSMEVPGSNYGRSFFMHLKKNFIATVLLEYLDPVIYSCLTFAL